MQAISAAERDAKLPPRLLYTISLVESGRRDLRTGIAGPWPWTINAEGSGLFFETKEQAIAAVQELQARGVHSIDVGCMQINLMYHAEAFASLEEAFAPQTNVAYGARFLNQLFVQKKSWPEAAAAYHSQTPEIGSDYKRRVMALWPLGQQYAGQPAADEAATQYTAEFARRVAGEASDRARLYAEMRFALPAKRRTARGMEARSLISQNDAIGAVSVR